MNHTPTPFAELVGLTLKSIDHLCVGDDHVIFTTEGGRTFYMFHEQDCCETVSIEEIHGDVQDLIGSEIVQAEESFVDPPQGSTHRNGSETWTFYKLATHKGYVTIRWYGESNGYYSETVSFNEIKRVGK